MIKTELLQLSLEQVRALLPIGILLGGTLLGILLSVTPGLSRSWVVMGVCVLTTALAMGAAISLFGRDPVVMFGGMFVVDGFSLLFYVLFLAVSGLTILSSFRYLDQEELQHPEYNLLVLFSCFGMMVMASALDLISIFIGLEIMSLSVYSLVGFRRADRRSNEASLKYFVLGGAASAILLYGTALVYGVTGTTNLKTILEFARASGGASLSNPVFIVGGWLLVAGFLFKVASVPFHMWMPDVYEGAPTPVTGFMTTALKAAAFATFMRVFLAMGGSPGVQNMIWVLAVATMIIGNVIALTQVNLKRMLGYSSIAHTGYLLIGLLVGPKLQAGFAPMLTYLVAYALMNLGAFMVLTQLSTKSDGSLNLHDLSGAARQHPFLSFAMAIFMFSMAGVPPTAGFVAKYLLFSSAVQAGQVSLVVIAVLCSAISVYYYLRVLVYMYMREPMGETKAKKVFVTAVLALIPMVILTLQWGILPAQVIEQARIAIASL